MIFALTMVPIIAVAGFAIDLQLAFSKKGKVQHSIDSAVLAGARMMQSTNSKAEVRKHTRAYFEAMTSTETGGLTCESLAIEFIDDENIEASTVCYQPTTLSRVIGQERVTFKVNAAATYGISKLDVAFVFDISGSMSWGTKLSDLKEAAKDAADTILPEPGSSGEGDVRIAMVAYNDMVNAGDYFEEVTGLKPRRTYTATNNTQKRETYIETEEECGYVCTRFTGRFGWCRQYEYQCREEEVEKERWVDVQETVYKTMTSTCVWERAGDHAFSDTQPEQLPMGALVSELPERSLNASDTGNNEEGFLSAGFAYWDDYRDRWNTTGTSCRNVEPFELNDNSTQIAKYIDDLWASGGTAGHQGIEWGWYLISERWGDVFDVKATPLPYDEPDSVKAMIIMTDGDFLNEHHVSQGDSNEQARKLCDEIKKEDIVIYTVAFEAPEKGEEVLEYCASGPEFAFKATNGLELKKSYQSIAQSIADLRIKS
ncbi:pilus assembly protein TadG-related protein [Henriciella sp. AS95]|uniref:pilus assembly protein TadG-related protein n=1 Tax=Henriciella sp. AS95 TaxID=3135782 RepID=UPI00316CCA9B